METLRPPLYTQEDVDLGREYFKESCELYGIDIDYRYPIGNGENVQGEPDPFTYSPTIKIRGIFEGTPKASTFKKLGWAVENQKELPFLIHLPWDVPKIQRNCIVTFSGAFSGVPARSFLVTELTTSLILPSCITCQIVPLRGGKLPEQETVVEKKERLSRPYTFLNPLPREKWVKSLRIKEDLLELKGERISSDSASGDDLWLRYTQGLTGRVEDGPRYHIDNSAKLFKFQIHPNNWTPEEDFFVYTINVPAVEINSVVDVSLDNTEDIVLAKQEFETARQAKISVYHAEDSWSTIYLRADGVKPSISLPIVVVINTGGSVLKGV